MVKNNAVEFLEPALMQEMSSGSDYSELNAKALAWARRMAVLPEVKESSHARRRFEKLHKQLQAIRAEFYRTSSAADGSLDEKQEWIADDINLLLSELAELQGSGVLTQTVHVRSTEAVPRVLAIAEDLLNSLKYRFSDEDFSAYLTAFQSVVALQLAEFSEVAPALKLVLLEHVDRLITARLSCGDAIVEEIVKEASVQTCIDSLREISRAPWKELTEPLIVFERILRQDPAGSYARMDSDTRQMYRKAVQRIAECSEYSEVEIAELAISLARQSLSGRLPDERVARRRSHVGYYLIAEGRESLFRRANVRLPYSTRLRAFLRRYPNDFYLLGIEILTAVLIFAVVLNVDFSSHWSLFFAALALLIPCSQSAVEMMNRLATSLLDPRQLPKLDFAGGVPEDCATMVVVPALLLNKKQVRQLVKELEVRYLGNMSPNLCFALLTDLPDSAERPDEDDPLVDLCRQLIEELNAKYSANGSGAFAMLHRHRVFNPREGVWMGAERKRGKLQELNRLILGEFDNFPVKAGDLSLLPRIRYVLTLDADTELPRGAAQRLIGTLAHPLCQAVIDQKRNIVSKGYGILQPRVGISIRSAMRSRLASIYSGETGFDVYTCAVSNVYQDLHGEGTFVGKGLYEVRTMQQVLDQRFPRNTILSHDLIEGAYTRAGLVSDVEVIDNFPSHYSAYVRRRHRWMRGDWQLAEWLLPKVPDEDGRRVPNPLSLLSRWMILDNIRRSMVAPAMFALLLLGWTVLPGSALYWTLASISILLAPALVQFFAGIASALICTSHVRVKNACKAFATDVIHLLLNLVFLLHIAMVCLDAIWRSLYRRIISGRRLLEWETTAESELTSRSNSPADLYLLATSAAALFLALVLYYANRDAFLPALPLLILWGCSRFIASWLDQPVRTERKAASHKDELWLRQVALRTWRYFAEFSTEEHHWLIPDNVQQERPNVLANVSPTNLGLLLNARQVACELGYLTVPEFVNLTRKTLDTMSHLQCYRGHLFNWYSTKTLLPISPRFVSSVDSGNLAASLLTLAGGCEALLDKPLLSDALLEGRRDYLQALSDLGALDRRAAKSLLRHEKQSWHLFAPELDIFAAATNDADAQWLVAEFKARRQRALEMAHSYMPWLLPEFKALRINPAFGFSDEDELLPLTHLTAHIQELKVRLQKGILCNALSPQEEKLALRLLELLAAAQVNAHRIVFELRAISAEAERWVSGMDFVFLLNKRRNLLSTGYNVEKEQYHPSCYDLLASEARTASFIAIAKNDAPQQAWFALGRAYAPVEGRNPTLISWTGTMFEYLMPSIWMRSYPDTVLHSAMKGAVREQQSLGATYRIPWGVSESGYRDFAETGLYHYRAFGVPRLAMHRELQRVVVTPYASALAIAVDATAALDNMKEMAKRGWCGAYGYYEAADFTSQAESTPETQGELVRSWMAHHQGMIMLAIANFLQDDVVQGWFYANACVQATDLLLQERPLLHLAEQYSGPRASLLPPAQVAMVKDLIMVRNTNTATS